MIRPGANCAAGVVAMTADRFQQAPPLKPPSDSLLPPVDLRALPLSAIAKCKVERSLYMAVLGSASTGLSNTVTTSSVDPAGLDSLGSSAASGRPDVLCNPNLNQPNQYQTS